MTMSYDGALVMPSSYAVMDTEEMTYVGGGWRIDNYWWGSNLYLTHNERVMLTNGQTLAGLAAALVSCGAGAAIVGAVGTIMWNMDDGHGIRLRLTGPLFNKIVTGVYTLSADDEIWVKNNPGIH